MRFFLSFLSILCFLPSCAAHTPASEEREPATVEAVQQPYRGWSYLVEQLKLRGIKEEKLSTIFNDPRMPEFSLVTFKLKPIESSSIYAQFRTIKKLEAGRTFLKEHEQIFKRLQASSQVNPEVITAILLVETGFGKNTGKELILNRLSRVSSVKEPGTLIKNLELLKAENPSVTLDQVKARAQYLEDTFLPEVLALFTMMERDKYDLFSLRGSIAGAFGIPQFLPSSFISFGVDGNKDGVVSLYDIEDAIFSTAHFLEHYGWKKNAPENEKRKVIWNYNRSQAYVDTIIWLASGMARRRI